MQTAIQALSTFDLGGACEVQSIPQPLVEKIFLRLSAQLGHKVADLYAHVDPQAVKAEWGSALAGYHPTEIKRGLDSCQTRVFAPTLGEFLRLCRPALDPETAYHEAREVMGIQRNCDPLEGWSHPAVARAAAQCRYELSVQTFSQIHKYWAYHLNREFAHGWEDPDPAPLTIKGPRKMAPPFEGAPF